MQKAFSFQLSAFRKSIPNSSLAPGTGQPAGFTLIEVVVTMFVIATLVVLLAAAVSTLSLTRSLRYSDIALRIAERKMEGLRAGGYASLPASGQFTDPLISSLPNASSSLAVAVFNAKTKQATVTVSWQETGKTQHVVSLSTLITETGGL